MDPSPSPPSSSDSARLFVALWPSADVRQALAAWQDAWQWPPGAVLVAPDRLHITLHFLGPVPRSRLDEIATGLDLASAPFALEVGRAAVWPHGVAVLEPVTTPPALAALHADLREALQALALPTDSRAFRPHVTLARHAAGAVPPAHGPSLHWTVHGHALVESRPARSGGYHVLRPYPATLRA